MDTLAIIPQIEKSSFEKTFNSHLQVKAVLVCPLVRIKLFCLGFTHGSLPGRPNQDSNCIDRTIATAPIVNLLLGTNRILSQQNKEYNKSTIYSSNSSSTLVIVQ
jgi:hypothetical protein